MRRATQAHAAGAASSNGKSMSGASHESSGGRLAAPWPLSEPFGRELLNRVRCRPGQCAPHTAASRPIKPFLPSSINSPLRDPRPQLLASAATTRSSFFHTVSPA